MSTRTSPSAGRRLRATRHAHQLTLAQLAMRAGVPASTIRVIEVGQTQTPRWSILVALAEALDVTPEWLLWGDEYAPGAP